MRMLLLLIFFAAIAIACGPSESRVRAPAERERATALVEPSANSRLHGRLYTISEFGLITPCTSVVITRGINAGWAEQNGAASITADNLGRLLAKARPLAPDDRLIDNWSYAPWCSATFHSNGREWSVELYLGGLGFIIDDAGRKGALTFDPPRVDRSVMRHGE